METARGNLLPKRPPVDIIVVVAIEIIYTRPFRCLAIASLVCSLSSAGSGVLLAIDLPLKKVPPLTAEQAPAYPENLARYHFGAQVEVVPDQDPVSNLELSSKAGDENMAEAALLCDDPTVGYALSDGSKTLLVTLSGIENIDTVSFLNHGMKGSLVIATSNSKLPPDSIQWHVVSQQDLAAEAIKAKVGPTEAKYLKLTFNVTEPGRISALGVYSTPTVRAFTMPRARKFYTDQAGSFALLSYSLTDLHAKARALYVSSGDDVKQANNMIDDQPATIYTFASNDPQPTVIIDVGEVATLRRISALSAPCQGNVDFYLLESLPGSGSGSAPEILKLDDAAVARLKLVGSVSNAGGRAAVDFPATTGRYIMVKWVGASQAGAPFSVAEIAAFTGNKPGSLMVANTTSVSRDGKDYGDGKDFGDGKDAKDIPSEGPEEPLPPPFLPAPPPFIFVPEIPPTSP